MTGSLAKMASLERGVTLMDMPEANEYLMDPGYMECIPVHGPVHTAWNNDL